MAAHNDFGKAGEQLASEWLEQRGFVIISRNWRFSRYEVDIIAHFNHVLHFIEVKTRRNDFFGNPEDWVDRKKVRNIMIAGVAYQQENPVWQVVQYDIISITLSHTGKKEIFFIEDVYWW